MTNFLMKTLAGVQLFVFALLVTSGQSKAVMFENGYGEVTYEISFIQSNYDSILNQTTFEYSVSVFTDPALSHFSLGFECTDKIVGFDPSTDVEYGEFKEPAIDSKITGIKWDGGQAVGYDVTYTVTLEGNVGEGDIDVYMKGGNENTGGNYVGSSSTVTGPTCMTPPLGTTYSVSGTVFMDVNKNSEWDQPADNSEPTFQQVTVSLLDAEGTVVKTVVTDESGYYEFLDVTVGEYTIVVQEVTALESDFNESLYANFTPTTETSIFVNVDSNLTGQNFGFAPNTIVLCSDTIVDNDQPCDFLGNGKTIGFWKHQLKVAIKGKGKAQISAGDMKILIEKVNELAYTASDYPFDLVGYTDALSILNSKSSAEVDLLLKQLLGSEFNYANEIGIDDRILLLHLIKWGEYIAKNSADLTRDDVLLAKDIFDGINNSGNNN